ncbi:MAG: hypothetical protein QW474_03905 [Candidatus Aenigmatarchaeota archaeon]
MYDYVRNRPVEKIDPVGLVLKNIMYDPKVLKCLSKIVRCAKDSFLQNAVYQISDIFLDTDFNPDFPSGWTFWPFYGFGKPQIGINSKAWDNFDDMCLTLTHELIHVTQGFWGSHGENAETEASEKAAEEYWENIRCCK